MAGSRKGLNRQQTNLISLLDVLHTAPRLYELLPHCSRQKLSATCSHLQQWVRERTSRVRVRHLHDLSRLAPTNWPNLVGIFLEADDQRIVYQTDVRPLLQGMWHLDVQVCFETDHSLRASEALIPYQYELLLVVSLLGHSQRARFDLTPHQHELLSQCANRQRSSTISVYVGSPHGAVRGDTTACSALCLPGNLWSCFSRQAWPRALVLGVYKLHWSPACAQDFVTCSFPVLEIIDWRMEMLDAPACAVLSQACLPSLSELVLSDQGVTAAGLCELVPASWPSLTSLEIARNNLDPVALTALSQSSWCRQLQKLFLSGNALGEEGVKALCVGQWEALKTLDLMQCGIQSHAAVTCLAQLHSPRLTHLSLGGNRFHKGAMAYLSGAQWPSLTQISLGFDDIGESDWDILGVDREEVAHIIGHTSERFTILHPNRDRAVLPVRHIVVEH